MAPVGAALAQLKFRTVSVVLWRRFLFWDEIVVKLTGRGKVNKKKQEAS